MAQYVVGDIQGCYEGLRRLLDKVEFDRKYDKLWAVGDLVARGPDSLKTLVFLHGLGNAFDTVLGNHDLHFVAIQAGIKPAKRSDLLAPLLKSKKSDELAAWLRSKPLAHRLDKDTLISHAGLYPQWSLKKAVKLSQEVQQQLVGENWLALISAMYGNSPREWDKTLQGFDRYRFIINAFTRMRFIHNQTTLEFETKSAPSAGSGALRPWFNVANTKLKKQQTVIFGHWATLMGQTLSSKFIGLDTGYVWGNSMTLFDLENRKKISIRNKG
ncbi:symmetrical bis(5'-nucleosyl)-tetraphosphatase [Aliiglaciecola sp. M165]|uniref:symmetrical bis(5'-nucleosyl)-tetraphosphatase n=1 Tax=Aliiglaciecola sp. M165 TaxID=2593649 RepID=UPI00117C9571|nr:symmetrical bis(5'-nucleosyl)-tetraphosphatase [Aliiglaciecola sp. M165]TRY30594.1 symmetrical bis(5'-nucleosyl)-tetraphosphatase [Aliiglaciecola sp. M165]